MKGLLINTKASVYNSSSYTQAVSRGPNHLSGSQMQSYPKTTHGPKRHLVLSQCRRRHTLNSQSMMHLECSGVMGQLLHWFCLTWARAAASTSKGQPEATARVQMLCFRSEFHKHSLPTVREGKVGGSPTACPVLSGGCSFRVAAFPKDSCTAYRVSWSKFAVKSHMSLPDLPTSTHRVFWAWWRLSWTYQAA